MSTPAVGYLRVSTEQQAGEQYTSLADQEEAIRALAGRLGVEVDRWFRDAGASGATVDGRPAFRELLGWCEQNRRPTASRGWVLVLNDSRFGRFPQPEEAAYWRHHLWRLGWEVRFAEGDDVEGHFRTVVRAIGSVQASEYRQQLIANTRRGMKGAANQGYWTRRAPFGYRRMVVYPPESGRVLGRGQHKASNEKVKLTPHEAEAAVVLWAFELYAAGGESLGSIAKKLKTRVPERRWSRSVVTAMLKNDAYRGAVVGGRRREGPSELYGCEDAHEAIVPPRLWQAVQRRLEKNAERGRGVRTTHYLLTGLLTCPYCGAPYTGGGGGRSTRKDPKRKCRRFYKDSGGVAGDCPGRIGTVTRHLVDDATVDVLASTIAKPAVRKRILRAIDRALEGRAEGESESSLRAARARVEERRERLVAALAAGTLLEEEAAGQLEKVRAELADLEARSHQARFARSRAQGARRARDRIVEAVLDFPEVARKASGPQLRELVEPWLGEATFDKVTRTLTLGIRPIPAMPSLHLSNSPGPGSPSPAWAAPGGRPP